MRNRRVWERVAWAGTAAVAARGVTGTWNVAASLAWLRSGSPASCPGGPVPGAAGEPAEGQAPGWEADRPWFVVLLPMLREQRLAADTVAYFTELARRWPRTSVVVVTTEREHVERAHAEERAADLARALADRAATRRVVRRFAGVLPRGRLVRLCAGYAGQPFEVCLAAVQESLAGVPDTPALAADLVAKARLDAVDAQHYHCPHPDAVMVHQLNYAGTAELARLSRAGLDPTRVWLAVYNADSRPDPATVPAAARAVTAVPAGQDGAPRILQQSALFTANLTALPGGPGGAVLAGAALLQSRWTLGREIPRLRRQSRQARRARRPEGSRGRWPYLAHCVGHGLFIRGDEFTARGGLPTASMNEDLAFGYLACAAGVPIDPLPLIEWADSPETVAALVRQGRQWFWSYLEYPRFARMAAAAGAGHRQGRAWLSVQGATRGGLWLGQSPAVAATVALPILARRRVPAVAATGAALSVYYATPFVLIGAELRRRGDMAGRVGARELTGGLAACLLSSAGPWWCCASAARRAATGAVYRHGKTER